MNAIKTVQDANQLSADDARRLIDLPAARAIDEDARNNPPPNGREPWPHARPQLGAWRLSRFGEASILVVIPVADFTPSEGDWQHALRHPTTQRYIRWAREGHAPPPLHVVRKHDGTLSSMNRRRWLAAREAGLHALACWYDPSSDVYAGRSRWYFPEYNEAKVAAYHIMRDGGRDPSSSLDAYELASIERHLSKDSTMVLYTS